ncbi:pilus assembly PilX family protein [Variovorax rhizosphaerae]|uniref:PilX N-terminal domain-containing pilus assembly protein n=1 Tax=Variovorax rhizosphaerae TaxID=1836200 RepID=A0ABU8WUD5_9BURK
MSTRIKRQRGVSMFIVLVMVMLSSLLVIWASRTALFSEMITGNDSDYQRAFEAAQAMVRDAEFDIMGTLADGKTECRNGAAYVGCRELAGGVFFPVDEADFQNLSDTLRTATPACVRGICLGNNGKFLNSKSELDAMKEVAATYGAYTGAKATAASNPLLITSAGKAPRAWYWVEVLPYDIGLATKGGLAQTYAPDADSPYVYRITAVAKGLKPNSMAVLQTVFVRKPVD